MGPFIGIDTHTSQDRESDNYALVSSNVDTNRNIGSLMTAMGRTPLLNFPMLNGPIVALARYDVSSVVTYYIAQSAPVNGFCVTGYISNVGDIGQLSGVNTPFLRGVQSNGALFLDNGQQIFFNQSYTLSSALWQYPAPSNFIGTITTPGFPLPAGTYSYAFVTIVALPFFGGTVYQQTSPYYLSTNAQYTTDQYGNVSYEAGGLTVNGTTQGIQINGVFNGTTPDGYSFTTAVYRMSSNTNVYQLETVVPPPAEQYNDTLADSYIAANQQLVLNRDQPPTGILDIGPGGYVTNYCNPIESAQNRMWVLAREQNPNTLEVPQLQLWYSEVGKPWSFDGALQVVLVDNASTLLTGPVNPNAANGTVFPLGQYGDTPVALAKIGSQVAIFGRKSTNMVYGTDETNYIVLPLFSNVGCIAPLSMIKYEEGKLAWFSAQGAMIYNQSALENISTEKMYNFLAGIPIADWPYIVGGYWRSTLYFSFPQYNLTLTYYLPNKSWNSLPYAVSAFTWDSSADHNGTTAGEYGSLIGARAGTAFIDYWSSSNQDLGNNVTATWSIPMSTSKASYGQKTYRSVSIVAPPQEAICYVTINVDPGYGVQSPIPATVGPIDLSQAPISKIYSLPTGLKGYGATVTITLTNNNSPAEIWDVTIGGTIDRSWAVNT